MIIKMFSSLSGDVKSSVICDTFFQCLAMALLQLSAGALAAQQLDAAEGRGHRLELSNSRMQWDPGG